MWLLLVVAATAFYTGLYWLWDRWSLSDSLYMTVITLTTVGFKEVRELDDVGRLITMAAAFSGAALIFGGVGIMAETLVADLTSGRRERRRMQQGVDRMTGHFIVCGYGRVGSGSRGSCASRGVRWSSSMSTRSPSSGRARTAMRSSRETPPTMACSGWRASRGPPAWSPRSTRMRTTSTSCSPRGRSTRACSSWAARRRSARSPSSSTRAPISIVSPYTMAGRRIAELATRPAVVDFIDAALSPAQMLFSIEERRIEAGSAFDGRTVGELADRGIFTLALVRGPQDLDPHPPRERRLAAGDELIVSASVETLRAFLGDT